MRQIAIALTALAVTAMYTVQANAGALSLLKFDGSINSLEDTDFESVIDADESGTLTEGDFFVGMFTYQTINGTVTSQFGASLSGIIVAKVDDISGTRVTFTNASSSDYTSLQGTLTNLPNRTSDLSALIVYDDTTQTNPDPVNQSFFINPDGSGTGLTGANDALTTATDGTKVFEFGFSGTTYAQAELFAGGTEFIYRLALNVTDNPLGIQFIPITSAESTVNNLDGGALPSTDIHADGGTDSGTLGDFDYRTDVNTYFKAIVPEPTSITLFLMGGLTLLGGTYHRKRRQSKVAA